MNSPGRLANKVALVTGAAGGIGYAAARRLAEEGARVVATDVQPPLQPFDSPAVTFHQLDVASEAEWKQVVAETITQWGRLDVLVNNAGISGSPAGIETVLVADWNKAFSVNVTGVLLGTQLAIPHMRRQGGGSIINLCSIWGNVAVPDLAVYHASKGAIRNMTKNMAVTYGKDNIRANSVHPGVVETPLTASQSEETRAHLKALTPLGRRAQAVEIANGILFLASEEASFITGAELVIDGGYLAM